MQTAGPSTALPPEHAFAALDAELGEPASRAVEGPRGGAYAATGGIRPRPRIRYNHQAMADAILQNPGIRQNDLAAMFGMTPAWISTVITSDAFQALLAARRAELVDPEIVLSLRERAVALTTRSMQVIQEKLARPADQVSDAFALKAFELGAKATALGGNALPPAPPDPSEYLPEIAERLMRLRGLGPVQPVSDATLVERVEEGVSK